MSFNHRLVPVNGQSRPKCWNEWYRPRSFLLVKIYCVRPFSVPYQLTSFICLKRWHEYWPLSRVGYPLGPPPVVTDTEGRETSRSRAGVRWPTCVISGSSTVTPLKNEVYPTLSTYLVFGDGGGTGLTILCSRTWMIQENWHMTHIDQRKGPEVHVQFKKDIIICVLYKSPNRPSRFI